MPEMGERQRNKATGQIWEWAGDDWHPVGDGAPVEPQGSAFGRLLSGAWSTTPFNPANLARMAWDAGTSPTRELGAGIKSGADTILGTDPRGRVASGIDTLKHLVGAIPGSGATNLSTATHLANAGQKGVETITGSSGDRLDSALRGMSEFGQAVPMIGESAGHAGERMADGDIAGGIGEIAGVASSALVPKVASRVPGAVSATGAGMETFGNALKPKGSMLRASVPGALILERLYHGEPVQAAAMAATPWALEYSGKGMQRLGSALEGIKRIGATPEGPQWDPSRPPPGWQSKSVLDNPASTVDAYESAIARGFSPARARQMAGMEPSTAGEPREIPGIRRRVPNPEDVELGNWLERRLDDLAKRMGWVPEDMERF